MNRLITLAIISVVSIISFSISGYVLPSTENRRCQGFLEGSSLTTRIIFDKRYAVVGSWKIVNFTKKLTNGEEQRELTVTIDQVVEVLDGQEFTTHFPRSVTKTFTGSSDKGLVYEAASFWCYVVIQARDDMPRIEIPWRNATPVRIT